MKNFEIHQTVEILEKQMQRDRLRFTRERQQERPQTGQIPPPIDFRFMLRRKMFRDQRTGK